MIFYRISFLPLTLGVVLLSISSSRLVPVFGSNCRAEDGGGCGPTLGPCGEEEDWDPVGKRKIAVPSLDIAARATHIATNVPRSSLNAWPKTVTTSEPAVRRWDPARIRVIAVPSTAIAAKV